MAAAGAHSEGFPLKGAAQPMNPMMGTMLFEKGIMAEQLRRRAAGTGDGYWAHQPSSMIHCAPLFAVQ